MKTEKVLKTLASIRPPKEEGYNNSTIQDAINACPVMKTFQSYGTLDPWQTGIFSAIGKMYDSFVDTRDEDVLTEITEDVVSVADEYLTDPENQALVVKDLPLLTDYMKKDPTPFKAGVVCAFTAILLTLKADEIAIAPDDDEPDIKERPLIDEAPEPDMTTASVPVPQEEIPKTSGTPRMADFNELIEALHVAGMNVNEISLNVVRVGNRNKVVMSSSMGPEVPFEVIAKINAVFRQMTGQSLTLTIVYANNSAAGVGFSHEI